MKFKDLKKEKMKNVAPAMIVYALPTLKPFPRLSKKIAKLHARSKGRSLTLPQFLLSKVSMPGAPTMGNTHCIVKLINILRARLAES